MRALRVVVFALLGLSAAGCSLVVGGDLDPLNVDLRARRTVSIRLIDFVPHVGQRVFVEFVRPADMDNPTSVVQAHAQMDPMPGACADITLPFGASVGATQVDFYADIGDDGLDSPPDDHTWRRELDESGRLEFLHEFNFEDVSQDRPAGQGTNLILDITGADAIEGSSVVASLVRTLDLNAGGGEPMIVDSVNAIYVSTIMGGNLGPRRGAGSDEPPMLRGVVDNGLGYTLELNVGGGMMRCRLEVISENSGDTTIAADFSAFTCDSETAVPVFENCSR